MRILKEHLKDADRHHLDHEEIDADVREAAEEAREGVHRNDDESRADGLGHLVIKVADEECGRLYVRDFQT